MIQPGRKPNIVSVVQHNDVAKTLKCIFYINYVAFANIRYTNRKCCSQFFRQPELFLPLIAAEQILLIKFMQAYVTFQMPFKHS